MPRQFMTRRPTTTCLSIPVPQLDCDQQMQSSSSCSRKALETAAAHTPSASNSPIFDLFFDDSSYSRCHHGLAKNRHHRPPAEGRRPSCSSRLDGPATIPEHQRQDPRREAYSRDQHVWQHRGGKPDSCEARGQTAKFARLLRPYRQGHLVRLDPATHMQLSLFTFGRESS